VSCLSGGVLLEKMDLLELFIASESHWLVLDSLEGNLFISAPERFEKELITVNLFHSSFCFLSSILRQCAGHILLFFKR
jgi:hypothetical protein